jgi:hypothetical protein
MNEHDDKLSARYRELAREEPPVALDAAILAASRRALGRPSFARRWGAPVSIAAVLMLAVGVTLHMQREEPGVETSEPGPAPAARSPAPIPDARKREATRKAAPAPSAHPAPMPSLPTPQPPMHSPASPPPTAESAAAGALEGKPMEAPVPAPARAAPAAAAPAATQSAERVQGFAAPKQANQESNRGAVRAPAASADALSQQKPVREERKLLPADPAAELERIARLRDDHRDEEADRALEEFRHRYPAYRIPNAVWERVRPR